LLEKNETLRRVFHDDYVVVALMWTLRTCWTDNRGRKRVLGPSLVTSYSRELDAPRGGTDVALTGNVVVRLTPVDLFETGQHRIDFLDGEFFFQGSD
jgi:hypothetical protein